MGALPPARPTLAGPLPSPTAPLLPPPPPTVLPPSAGALTSRRPLILTPSSICFRGVACPAAKLLARPLRYSIAARAAARSKGSSYLVRISFGLRDNLKALSRRRRLQSATMLVVVERSQPRCRRRRR